MAQTFNPEHVLLSDSIGKEVADKGLTNQFLDQLVKTSKVIQLGQQVPMDAKMLRTSEGLGELSHAYFVGEGEKIGTATFEGQDYVLEAKKIGVILPVTEEFLQYTWKDYFNAVVPLIVDKFNKQIDGAAFLGLHGNVFGNNVLAAAEAAGNISPDLTADGIYDLETMTNADINAFVGHRTVSRTIRGLVDTASQTPLQDRAAGTLDGVRYEELVLANGEVFPENTLLAGNFNGLKYGIPNGTNLRLKIADQATLSKVQNVSPDTGDVHLFEQDMQALRAIFEIAVAIPVNDAFAVIKPSI